MKFRTASETIETTAFSSKNMSPLPQIEKLFVQASLSQEITETDWQQIAALSEQDPLSPEARRMVKRILHGVRRGWVTVLG